MKKKSSSQSAFFNFRVLFLLCAVVAVLVFGAFGQRSAQDQKGSPAQAPPASQSVAKDPSASASAPTELSGPSQATSASTNEAGQPTLTTDREDYPPFSYVFMTGTGFEPGETVNLIASKSPFEQWEVVADENGNFETSWFMLTPQLIGATTMQ